MKEYIVVEQSSAGEITKEINDAVANGWELMGCVQVVTKIEWVGGIKLPVAYYVATMVREIA
jgi:hypothetical protein